MLKVGRAKIKAGTDGNYDWGTYYYFGLDFDNDPATGDTAGGGIGAGYSADGYLYPYSGPEGTLKFKTGSTGSVRMPASGSAVGEFKTNGRILDDDYALVEVSVARSILGNPASGITVRVDCKTSDGYTPGERTFVLK